MAFVDKLVPALEERGFEVFLDRRNLPALEDWERELLGIIQKVDTVIFVVSPHSVQSKVCAWEITQVAKASKRLAPVVIDHIGNEVIPAEITKLNYLFFNDGGSFDQKVDDLSRALNADVVWLKEHTRIAAAARRWEERQKSEHALLPGAEVDEVASWAARRPREAPVVTSSQLEFIEASRKGEQRRRERERAQHLRARRTIMSAGTLAVLLIATGGAAYWYYAEATGQCSASQLYSYATGRFEKKDGKWIEYKAETQFAVFREMRQDPTYVWLADNSRLDPIAEKGRTPLENREMIVRIPKCGGQVEWSWSNPLVWNPFQVVERIETSPFSLVNIFSRSSKP